MTTRAPSAYAPPDAAAPSSSAAVPALREPTEDEIRRELARISPEGLPPRRGAGRFAWAVTAAVFVAAGAGVFAFGTIYGGSVVTGFLAVAIVIVGGALRAAPSFAAMAFRKRDRKAAIEAARARLLRGDATTT